MKVTLLRRLAHHKAGATVDYDNAIAAWLISHGHAKQASDKQAKVNDTGRAEQVLTPEQTTHFEEASEGENDTPVGPPPRAGRGSTTLAWRTYARSHGVTVADDADRDDIITACRDAGIPTD